MAMTKQENINAFEGTPSGYGDENHVDAWVAILVDMAK